MIYSQGQCLGGYSTDKVTWYQFFTYLNVFINDQITYFSYFYGSDTCLPHPSKLVCSTISSTMMAIP